jgi:hypothetical protein
MAPFLDPKPLTLIQFPGLRRERGGGRKEGKKAKEKDMREIFVFAAV